MLTTHSGTPMNRGRNTYSLMPHHPEALTHVLTRYVHPRVPRAVYTSLSIPTETSSTEDKDEFACMFLANWTSDRSESRAACQALPCWTPWSEYIAWRDSGEREVQSSMCLLQRFHDYSMMTAERSRQCRARRPTQLNMTSEPDNVHAIYDSDDDSFYGDVYDLDVITHDMMEAEMATLTEGTGARGSLAGALKFFGSTFPTPASSTPLGLSCIHSVNIRNMTSAANNREKQLSGANTISANYGHLSLEKNGDNSIKALLIAAVRSPAAPVISTVNVNDPEHFAKLFTPMKQPPSIADTILLFTLEGGQAQMFVLLATEMDEVLNKRTSSLAPITSWFSKEPLRLLVLGPPGTGKTRVQLAFQWYAYQRGVHKEILLTAYPHKAAALLNSPVLTARTTCAMMGINPKTTQLHILGSNAFTKSQTLLEGGRWLIMDEVSFYSQSTLALASKALHRHAEIRNLNTAEFFGAVSVVLTGDLTQHNPPAGKPLTSGASGEVVCEQHKKADIRFAVNANADSEQGRRIFRSFENVIILNKQQRMKNDPAFAAISATFASEDAVTSAQIDAFCDLVNTSVPDNINDLLHRRPRIVVTRNDIKNHVARALDISQVRI